MSLSKFSTVCALAVLAPALGGAQQPPAPDQPAPAAPAAAVPEAPKIAVIDIDRVAAESDPGKALLEELKKENERIAAERQKREQEIRDMTAKLTSDVLSQEARERLQREIERKRTEAQRWLEDAQREFQEKQQDGEERFQRQLAPVVEQVARELGIDLILRATPGLTFVLNPALDISPLVVQRLNEVAAQPPPGDEGAGEPRS